MLLGIDFGGTNIKAVIADKTGAVLASRQCPTAPGDGMDAMLDKLCLIAGECAADVGISLADVRAAGIGIPGIVDQGLGRVIFAPNITVFEPIELAAILSRRLGFPIVLGNDAGCMAMAESVIGAGSGKRSFIMLTLGTAVGAAAYCDGRIFSGFGKYGGELGHIPLAYGGMPCSCGVNGCYEQYASANALVWQTIELARKDRSSVIWQLCSGDETRIDSKTAFTAAEMGDKTAAEILDRYTDYTSAGIAGLVNIFRPEAVLIGGGLANAGDSFIQILNEKVFQFTYASDIIGAPPVLRSKLGDGSGALGAALLAAH